MIGILADTHNHLKRTQAGVRVLQEHGAEVLVHCGDLASREIVEICAVLPLYFVFGNHDADSAADLKQAAAAYGATCLEWGGEFEYQGKRIAVVHGHISLDVRPLLEAEPDYLLSGHSHTARDWQSGPTRRINPGALFRTLEPSVALLDVVADAVRFMPVDN
jgi:putative phosphoesterase